MYANPVCELAKCTRKCIRKTINRRSSRGGSVAKLPASFAKLSQPRYPEFYRYSSRAASCVFCPACRVIARSFDRKNGGKANDRIFIGKLTTDGGEGVPRSKNPRRRLWDADRAERNQSRSTKSWGQSREKSEHPLASSIPPTAAKFENASASSSRALHCAIALFKSISPPTLSVVPCIYTRASTRACTQRGAQSCARPIELSSFSYGENVETEATSSRISARKVLNLFIDIEPSCYRDIDIHR